MYIFSWVESTHENLFTQKKFYTEIILHLSLVIIFTRVHTFNRSAINYIYVMAAAIEHVHRRACCVRSYHVYREQLLVKYSRYADLMEQTVISLTPLESFRENEHDAAATPWFGN